MTVKNIIFHNVLMTGGIDKADFFEGAQELKQFVIGNHLIPIDPIFYVELGNNQVQLGVQMNREVNVEGQNFMFYPTFGAQTCIHERVLEDKAIPDVITKMKEYANENGYTLLNDNYVCLPMELYGDIVSDLYLFVKKVGA